MGNPRLTRDRWVSCWHFIQLIIFKYLLRVYIVGVGETDCLLIKTINKKYIPFPEH